MRSGVLFSERMDGGVVEIVSECWAGDGDWMWR